MGLNPDLFAYGGFVDPIDGNEFSPGGGQMMTCRDHLRVAQLLINKGKWADDDGGIQGQSAVPTPAAAAASGVDLAAASDDVAPAMRPYKQLLTEEFVEEFLQPSYPNVTQSYGFLVWYVAKRFIRLSSSLAFKIEKWKRVVRVSQGGTLDFTRAQA